MNNINIWKKLYGSFQNCASHNKLIFRNQMFSIRGLAALERELSHSKKRAAQLQAERDAIKASFDALMSASESSITELGKLVLERDALAAELNNTKSALQTCRGNYADDKRAAGIEIDRLRGELAAVNAERDSAVDSAEYYKHTFLGMQTTIDNLAAELATVKAERNDWELNARNCHMERRVISDQLDKAKAERDGFKKLSADQIKFNEQVTEKIEALIARIESFQ